MGKHVSNGITHSGAKKWKCTKCGKRLTEDEYKNGECKDE